MYMKQIILNHVATGDFCYVTLGKTILNISSRLLWLSVVQIKLFQYIDQHYGIRITLCKEKLSNL